LKDTDNNSQQVATQAIDRAERTIAFWNSTPDSIHSVDTIIAVLDIAQQTLQNMRCDGDGPKFLQRKRLVYYRKQDVVDWINETMGESVASTSQRSENRRKSARRNLESILQVA
jgi:hypothetical protein